MDLIGGLKKFFDSKHTATNEEFETKGFLSPEQFVEAGDQLTNFGWKWEKALTKPTKLLPPNKQFMSSQATSKFRIKSIHNDDISEEMVDGFLVPSIKNNAEKEEDYRIYKVYITYDDYYHTPRLWLSGNDKQGRPLNSKQIFEDIIAEYQHETVTEDTHPFLGNDRP
jgi:ubiquitin-like-conjugating enzyme ATG3